jgi:prophage maintenance system killer protein
VARTYAPLAVGTSSGLVAAYAFGPAKHHRVVDGNERTAFFALGLFLEINGWRLETTEIDAIESTKLFADPNEFQRMLAFRC